MHADGTPVPPVSCPPAPREATPPLWDEPPTTPDDRPKDLDRARPRLACLLTASSRRSPGTSPQISSGRMKPTIGAGPRPFTPGRRPQPLRLSCSHSDPHHSPPSRGEELEGALDRGFATRPALLGDEATIRDPMPYVSIPPPRRPIAPRVVERGATFPMTPRVLRLLPIRSRIGPGLGEG
jgi:hypothetical protein